MIKHKSDNYYKCIYVVIFYFICTVNCVITSTSFTFLNIRYALNRVVELNCQCMDSIGVLITETRWFFNGNLVLTQDDGNYNSGDPYYNSTAPATLLIDIGINVTHNGTYTCSPNNMFPTLPPGDAIAINITGENDICICMYYFTNFYIQPHPYSTSIVIL